MHILIVDSKCKNNFESNFVSKYNLFDHMNMNHSELYFSNLQCITALLLFWCSFQYSPVLDVTLSYLCT